MPHVASTATADNLYVEYLEGGGNLKVPGRKVLVKGGIGIANRMLVTPTGATLTEVTDEEADMLEENEAFQMHAKAGFVQIIRSKKVDGDRAAADMKTKDGSAPMTPSDYQDKNKEDPSVLSVNSGKAA